MKSAKSFLIRIAGVLTIVAIAFVILADPVSEARKERRIKEMLLTVQEALQRYHVAEEIYPRRVMKGGELIDLLRENGHLEEVLMNPWVGGIYNADNEVDRMAYETDALAESYELTVRYMKKDDVRFRLDSTENQSLE